MRARVPLGCALPLLRANARYWPSVAPVVRAELRRWRVRAAAVPDERLRAVAVRKLREEGFNAQVAATLGILAPRATRAGAVRAIVALEVLYDYLDGLIANAPGECAGAHLGLFAPLCEAVALAPANAPPGSLAARARAKARCVPASPARPGPADGGYAQALAAAVRVELGRLPAARDVLAALEDAARRTAEGQVQAHRSVHRGTGALRAWAERQPAAASLPWPELAAGAAASVLAMHALIAAAADRRTSRHDAAAIDAAYLRVAAVSTMLDGIADHARDLRTGRPAPIEWCAPRAELEARLRALVAGARDAALALRGGGHAVIATGVVAYYTPPRARANDDVRRVLAACHRELRPAIVPALAVMRVWRLAKRARVTARAPLRGRTARSRVPSARSFSAAGASRPHRAVPEPL